MLIGTAILGCDAGEVLYEVPTEESSVVSAAQRETAAARWTALRRTIVGRREFGPLGTARTYALVSVAQYNAVIAAADAKDRGLHPSEAGASAAAAAAVLRALYPMESAAIDAQLASDALFLPRLPSERSADFAAGMAVGEQVAAAVLARAATDGSSGARCVPGCSKAATSSDRPRRPRSAPPSSSRRSPRSGATPTT